MKRWSLILVIILLLCVLPMVSHTSPAEEPKFEAQTFKVTIEVVYNAITLGEAAEKEELFKKAFKDACKIDISLADRPMNGYMIISQ